MLYAVNMLYCLCYITLMLLCCDLEQNYFLWLKVSLFSLVPKANCYFIICVKD